MLLTTACGPRHGWMLTQRVCQAEDPPRICFEAAPDAPLSLEVGGETLVPGECAFAPKTRWVRISAVVVDGREDTQHRVRVESSPGGTATVVVTEDDDALEIEVVREGC